MLTGTKPPEERQRLRLIPGFSVKMSFMLTHVGAPEVGEKDGSNPFHDDINVYVHAAGDAPALL